MKRFKTLVFLFFAIFGDLAVAEEKERARLCHQSLRETNSMDWLPNGSNKSHDLKNSARAPLSAYLLVQYARSYFGSSKLSDSYIMNVIKNEFMMNPSVTLFRMGELIYAELLDAGLQNTAKLRYQGLKSRPELEAQFDNENSAFDQIQLKSKLSINDLNKTHPQILILDRFGTKGDFKENIFLIFIWDSKSKSFNAIDPLMPERIYEVEFLETNKSSFQKIIKQKYSHYFKISAKNGISSELDSYSYIPMAVLGLLENKRGN